MLMSRCALSASHCTPWEIKVCLLRIKKEFRLFQKSVTSYWISYSQFYLNFTQPFNFKWGNNTQEEKNMKRYVSLYWSKSISWSSSQIDDAEMEWKELRNWLTNLRVFEFICAYITLTAYGSINTYILFISVFLWQW